MSISKVGLQRQIRWDLPIQVKLTTSG